MSRDYSGYGKSKKHSSKSHRQTTRRRPARAKNRSGGLFWFCSGLAVGSLATAMLLVPDIRPEMPAVGGDSGKPAGADTHQPQFEFHNLLGDDEVVVVQPAPAPASSRSDSQAGSRRAGESSARSAQQTAVGAGSDIFLLQAGSFRSSKDADERRVQLLLMNLRASVEKAKTSNGDTRYRVIVGPFGDRRAVNAALNRISSNGIETLLLKRKKI